MAAFLGLAMAICGFCEGVLGLAMAGCWEVGVILAGGLYRLHGGEVMKVASSVWEGSVMCL